MEQEYSRNHGHFEVSCFAFDFSRTEISPQRHEFMEITSVVKGNSMQKGQQLLIQNKRQTVLFTGRVVLLPWDKVLVTIKWSTFSDVWSQCLLEVGEGNIGATEFILYDSCSFLSD